MNPQEYISKGGCHKCVDCSRQFQYQYHIPTFQPQLPQPVTMLSSVGINPQLQTADIGYGVTPSYDNPMVHIAHYAPIVIYPNNPQKISHKKHCKKKHCKKCRH